MLSLVQMDRASLEQMLAEAEQRVTLCELPIARQREVIAKLERDGHDTDQALDLLELFLAMQASLVKDCDRRLERLKFSN